MAATNKVADWSIAGAIVAITGFLFKAPGKMWFIFGNTTIESAFDKDNVPYALRDTITAIDKSNDGSAIQLAAVKADQMGYKNTAAYLQNRVSK